MSVTDPVADMLTRIRNANNARRDSVDIPSSKLKAEIARILYKEGYIKSYDIRRGDVGDIIRIHLKYNRDKTGAITGIKRISKPGLRVYAGKDNIPKVLGGFGTAVISTSKGVLTDSEARKLGVGGEVICFIW